MCYGMYINIKFIQNSQVPVPTQTLESLYLFYLWKFICTRPAVSLCKDNMGLILLNLTCKSAYFNDYPFTILHMAKGSFNEIGTGKDRR